MEHREQICFAIYYILSTLEYSSCVLKGWMDKRNLIYPLIPFVSQRRDSPTYSLANGLPITSFTEIPIPNFISLDMPDMPIFMPICLCMCCYLCLECLYPTLLDKLFLLKSAERASLFLKTDSVAYSSMFLLPLILASIVVLSMLC